MDIAGFYREALGKFLFFGHEKLNIFLKRTILAAKISFIVISELI